MVLLLDDDPDLGHALCLMVSKLGYKCQHVTTVQAALDRVRKGGVRVVVVDIVLPERDGNEFLREIQSWKHEGEAPPVVVLTGDRNKLQKDVAGVPRSVSEKPVGMSQLAQILEPFKTKN